MGRVATRGERLQVLSGYYRGGVHGQDVLQQGVYACTGAGQGSLQS